MTHGLLDNKLMVLDEDEHVALVLEWPATCGPQGP